MSIKCALQNLPGLSRYISPVTVFNIPYFITEVLDFGCSDAMVMLVFLNAYDVCWCSPPIFESDITLQLVQSRL